ncbi:MAG: 30S ribosome-binding factor RbfA [bacterium]
MPYDYSRAERVAEIIRRDLSQLIRQRVKDPRIGMVTLLNVEVSRDLAYAKVYFDTLDESSAEITETILNKAAGFLRHELGQQLKLRVTPSLSFIYDDTEVKANALSALIDKALKSDQH